MIPLHPSFMLFSYVWRHNVPESVPMLVRSMRPYCQVNAQLAAIIAHAWWAKTRWHMLNPGPWIVYHEELHGA